MAVVIRRLKSNESNSRACRMQTIREILIGPWSSIFRVAYVAEGENANKISIYRSSAAKLWANLGCVPSRGHPMGANKSRDARLLQ